MASRSRDARRCGLGDVGGRRSEWSWAGGGTAERRHDGCTAGHDVGGGDGSRHDSSTSDRARFDAARDGRAGHHTAATAAGGHLRLDHHHHHHDRHNDRTTGRRRGTSGVAGLDVRRQCTHRRHVDHHRHAVLGESDHARLRFVLPRCSGIRDGHDRQRHRTRTVCGRVRNRWGVDVRNQRLRRVRPAAACGRIDRRVVSGCRRAMRRLHRPRHQRPRQRERSTRRDRHRRPQPDRRRRRHGRDRSARSACERQLGERAGHLVAHHPGVGR